MSVLCGKPDRGCTCAELANARGVLLWGIRFLERQGCNKLRSPLHCCRYSATSNETRQLPWLGREKSPATFSHSHTRKSDMQHLPQSRSALEHPGSGKRVC
jgi:hypothetical protein